MIREKWSRGTIKIGQGDPEFRWVVCVDRHNKG